MRVIIASTGSWGDINPYLAIGSELIRRGHRALMLANPLYRNAIESTGMEFAGVGSSVRYAQDLRRLETMGNVRSTFELARWLLGQIETNVRSAHTEIKRYKPDVVLRHILFAGMKWACDEHSIPSALGVVAPVAWLSVAERRAGRSRVGWALVRPAMGAIRMMARTIADLTIERSLSRIRRRMGFRHDRHLLIGEWFGANVVLGLWSKSFRPPMPDDPPHGVICGFPFLDAAETQGDGTWRRIQSFLSSGPAPVVFTLGSTGIHARGAGRFYEAAGEVCVRLGVRGILLTGPSVKLDLLSRDVLVVESAPHSQLFPRARAVVTHGGIGTMAQALRVGLPMVVIPLLFDQPDAARRAMRLGVARLIPPSHLTVSELEGAVRDILENPVYQYRARAVQELIKSEAGAATVASELEKVPGRPLAPSGVRWQRSPL